MRRSTAGVGGSRRIAMTVMLSSEFRSRQSAISSSQHLAKLSGSISVPSSLWRKKAATSLSSNTSQIPSLPRTRTSSSFVLSIARTSGTATTACSWGGFSRLLLKRKSPRDLDTARTPPTRDFTTVSPAPSIRSFSFSRSGLWHSVREVLIHAFAEDLRRRARQSPEFATSKCEGVTRLTSAVAPLPSSVSSTPFHVIAGTAASDASRLHIASVRDPDSLSGRRSCEIQASVRQNSCWKLLAANLPENAPPCPSKTPNREHTPPSSPIIGE
mmetsp:Transcript_6765/g.12542  ORF Transcript_6765/g.12542 Transcript_6765/m.12542 type:complete len:271 (-) Transcript_6765:1260-2072(-)